MARSTGVLVLAVVSFVFGILALVVAILIIPAFGIDYYNAVASKTGLFTIIGSLGLVGGLLCFVAAVGIWRMAKWGWTLEIVAGVLVLAGAVWASITVFDVSIPVVELALAVLVLALSIALRSAFRGPARGGTVGGPVG